MSKMPTNRYIEYIEKTNFHTNVYGLARSLLAFALLTTFLFNSRNYLFNEQLFSDESAKYFFDSCNFFKIFGFKNLPTSIFVACVILLWTISGFLPQISALLHFWVANSFLHVNALLDGGDMINSNLCLLLIPVALTDKRFNHWSFNQSNIGFYSNAIVFFTSIGIMLQMSVLYLHSGMAKFSLDEWNNGTAIYYWVNNPTFGVNENYRAFFNFFLGKSWLVTISTWGVLVIEILLFAALFLTKEMKLRVLFLGILFHTFIILLHGLVSFSLSMFGGLLLYLFPWEKHIRFTKILKEWNLKRNYTAQN